MNKIVGPGNNHQIIVHIDKPFKQNDREHIASMFEGSEFDRDGSWVIKFYNNNEMGSVRYYENNDKVQYFYPKNITLGKFLDYINHVQASGYKITKIYGARVNNEGLVKLSTNYKRGFKPMFHPTFLIA